MDKKDGSDLKNYFSDKIIYSECYGPEYIGPEQVEKWFEDWNKQGNVIEWNIKQFIHSNEITVVEWYFKLSGKMGVKYEKKFLYTDKTVHTLE